jgi:hypothetical protein
MAMFNEKIMNDNETMKLELGLIFLLVGNFYHLVTKTKSNVTHAKDCYEK